MCCLGYNVESFLIELKNLNEFEFGKSLLKIREYYCESEKISNVFNEVINNYDLTKKEIRTIISNTHEDNKEFIEKIKRSIKSNKNDVSSDLARKLGKHCKRESTENPNKQKEVKKDHISTLLSMYKLSEICAKLPRIVLFLDNAKAHKTDLVKYIAKTLNIYLLPIPEYSPDLAPVELVFKILKDSLKSNMLKTKEKIIDKCFETFKTKCMESGIYEWFLEKYLSFIN